MKKLLCLVLFIQASSSLKAQDVSYEKLDSLSNEISKLQLTAYGHSVNDNGDRYNVSFADENFRVFYHNKLAIKSVYKESKNREVLTLTEGIDLTKAKGITLEKSYQDSIVVVKLYFPKGYLKTQILENGNVIKTVNEEYLEFYSNLSPENFVLFDRLVEICESLQIDKGLISWLEIAEESRDWISLSPGAFLQRHRSSLRAMQAELIIQNELDEMQRKHLIVFNFIDSLSNEYKFKEGLTKSEFREYNTEAAHIMTPKNVFDNRYNVDKLITFGPKFILFDKKDRLTSYSYGIIKGKMKQADVWPYFDNIVQQIEGLIPGEFIRKSKDQTRITIYDPKMSIEVSYDFWFFSKVSGVFINFNVVDP